jgi:hypothetical protein
MIRFLKWTAIIVAGGFLLFVIFVMCSLASMFDFGPIYTKKDLLNNYQSKEVQISEVKNYVNSITPSDTQVDIEFDKGDRLFIFHVTQDNLCDCNWDIQMDAAKADTLLGKLHWTRTTLNTLKSKLNAANCISVRSGEPCQIGFKRSGMGIYFYDVFSNPIADSLKSHYNDSCTYILYSNRVALEYGGGAVGPQCFSKE